jgi:hypothetical protein
MAENLPTEREKTKKAMGRPSIRSDALIEEILRRLAEGEPLAVICRDPHMPGVTTVWEWEKADAELSEAIARARDVGADAIAAESLEIIDEEPEYVVVSIGDNATEKRIDSASVQRSKNRAEHRLKLLAKWNPRKYGDRIDVTSGGEKLEASDGLSLQQAAKLAAILAEAEKRKEGE